MGGLHLVFSDQRLNYTGFCVFEDLLVQADLLLMQEEDLLLVQEEDLLLVQIFFLYKKKSDFLRFGTALGKSFPNYFSKSTEGLSNIDVSEFTSRIYRIQPIQPIFSIRCQRLRLGPYLPHAPGVRMTVVKLTPSNE